MRRARGFGSNRAAGILDLMTVEVTLNGDPVVLDELTGNTLQALILQQSLRGDRIAVERNGEIVPRVRWPMTELSSGDRIEVVHFVGGGLCGIASEMRFGTHSDNGGPSRRASRASHRSP